MLAHFFDQSRIDNPRSNEVGPLDVFEHRLLEPDVIELEPPNQCLETMNYDRHLEIHDPWGDNHRSLRNLLHQLHSLARVGTLATDTLADVYLFLRPDLRYLDDFKPFIQYAAAVKEPTIFFPNWQHHGGMNDRFALIAGQDAARIYSTRGSNVWEFTTKFGGKFNGERLLKYSVLKAGLRAEPVYLRAERVRSTGTVRIESFRRPKSKLSKTTLRFLWLRLITRSDKNLATRNLL